MSTRALVVAATLLAAITSTTLAARPCSDEEQSAFDKVVLVRPPKCLLQQSPFEVCDDDCLRWTQELLAVSTNCSSSAYTAYEETKTLLDRCDEARTNATNKYMPLHGTGLVDCSPEQTSEWEEKYGRASPVRDCTNAISGSCSDECLKILEESVTKAPPCAHALTKYWFGEAKKYPLMLCLLARGESLASNDVMQSVKNVDGSVTRANTTVTTSAPPSQAKPDGNSTNSATDTSSPISTSTVPTKDPSSSANGRVVYTVVILSIAVFAGM